MSVVRNRAPASNRSPRRDSQTPGGKIRHKRCGVRAFSRAFDTLVVRVPFVVELGSVQGLKTYSRKD